MIVETHAHLAMDSFDADRDEVISRNRKAGVVAWIEVAFDFEMSRRVIALSEKYTDCFCSVGIHPHHAADVTDELLSQVATLASHKKVVAWGEIGLDYFRNLSPKDIQIKSFLTQLQAAKNKNLPVIIHCRDAHADMKRLISEVGNNTPCGVIHSFSGTTDDAAWYIEKGFVIGIGGPLTYPKNDTLKDVVKNVPIEKIILETDAPYLPPQPYRGKRNEPGYLKHVVEEISKIKQTELSLIEEKTTKTAIQLFGLPL